MEDATPTEPQVTDDIEYDFQLTVTDCTGAVTVGEVTQIVQCTGADENDTAIDCEAADE